jgi:hypothetical protein
MRNFFIGERFDSIAGASGPSARFLRIWRRRGDRRSLHEEV